MSKKEPKPMTLTIEEWRELLDNKDATNIFATVYEKDGKYYNVPINELGLIIDDNSKLQKTQPQSEITIDEQYHNDQISHPWTVPDSKYWILKSWQSYDKSAGTEHYLQISYDSGANWKTIRYVTPATKDMYNLYRGSDNFQNYRINAGTMLKITQPNAVAGHNCYFILHYEEYDDG